MKRILFLPHAVAQMNSRARMISTEEVRGEPLYDEKTVNVIQQMLRDVDSRLDELDVAAAA